jgi:hypothetical protein
MKFGVPAPPISSWAEAAAAKNTDKITIAMPLYFIEPPLVPNPSDFTNVD